MKKKLAIIALLQLAATTYFFVKKPEGASNNRNGVTNLDKETLDQLRRAGSNLEKPHEFDFYLYFPSQAAAERADAEVQNAGFTAVVRPAATGSDWLCLASKTLVPTLEELSSIRQFFSNLSDNLNGEYDGWEAKVEKE